MHMYVCIREGALLVAWLQTVRLYILLIPAKYICSCSRTVCIPQQNTVLTYSTGTWLPTYKQLWCKYLIGPKSAFLP